MLWLGRSQRTAVEHFRKFRLGAATLPRRFDFGTNEIASAIAVYLYHRGYGVVLSHDPSPPVIRRKMAFHDALFEEVIDIEGVIATRADRGLEVQAGLARRNGVIITELGILDLMVLRTLNILIDARMQKYQVTPDLRRLARVTIGLGPGFTAGENCDIAIETRPGKAGRIIQDGATDAADGTPNMLGTRGAERFVRSTFAGRWHSPLEIGTRIFKDFVVGHLGGEPVRAPFDGILRGVVRDGTEVPADVKLLEIDPRGRKAKFTGIDSRGHAIAKAACNALSFIESGAEPPTSKRGRRLYLVR